MPKKRRARHQPPRRPQVRHREPGPKEPRAEDQALFVMLRGALRSDEPLELIGLVSGLLNATDTRHKNPFATEKPPERGDLIESLIGTPYAETTAALTVMAALLPDEVTAQRIRRELAGRRHPLPAWLVGLAEAQVEPEVWFLGHVLGDGDDYLVGATLPSGHRLAALVYVDHNLGTVVKDAFVVPTSVEDMALQLEATLEDPDQTLTLTDPARARAVVEDAIEHGSLLYPPLESDDWPACRPVVEWLVRMLPSGGEAPPRREWSEEELGAIADDFFASRFGRSLDRADERSLLGGLLWFGTDYANGDPLRWSTVTVELLLADWFPRKIVADAAYLAKLPNLLRSFLRYAHRRVGIRDDLTEDTLAAIDAYEPDYQRTIRSERLQGPEALLASLFDGMDDDGELLSGPEIMLDRLAQDVGGRDRLDALATEPLPDEPFDWSGVPEDVHAVVGEIVELCDRCAEALFDVEHRTAMRRFLHRAAVGDPAAFRRAASPVRGAAAVAWVIGRANDSVGEGTDLLVRDLMAWFGITGSVSQRAEPLLRANGVNPHELFGTMQLGTPDLLTAQRRSRIVTLREVWLAAREREAGDLG